MSKAQLFDLFLSPKYQLEVSQLYLEKALYNPQLPPELGDLLWEALDRMSDALAGLDGSVGLTHHGGATVEEGSPPGCPDQMDVFEGE